MPRLSLDRDRELTERCELGGAEKRGVEEGRGRERLRGVRREGED